MTQNEFHEWGLESQWQPKLPDDLDISSLPTLDPKSSFILSRVDGMTNLADICALSGLSQSECLQRLAQLLEQGIIVCEGFGQSPSNGSDDSCFLQIRRRT